MATTSLPRKPVKDWEKVRDEWVEAVDRFMTDVEAWSARQDWATLRDSKTIEEGGIGPYTVSRLLVHTVFGRFVFDPVGRLVVGAEGLIDFFILPSYDWEMIVRSADGSWNLHVEDGGRVRKRRWTEKVFVELIQKVRPAA